MNMPGFAAEASLHDPGQPYRALRIVDRGGPRVMPQLRPVGIGFCMSTCEPDDWQCLFDCLAVERDPFRRFP